MLKKIVLVFAAVAVAKAQIPSLGGCPEYIPMTDFDMGKFLGLWYEAERYFQLSEVVSRCVATNYTRSPDGKMHVSNEVINRFTGVKRIIEGEIKPAASKSEQGKLHVKYNALPFTPETRYSVLETDYKSFAVLWDCQGVGLVHAQNAWVMTRKRVPSAETLQKAYGVLDKYKISKTFFVKTDQADCAYELPEPVSEEESAPAPAAPAPAKEPAATESAAEKKAEAVHVRSAGIIPEVEAIDESRKEEPETLVDAPAEAAIPIVPVDEVRKADPEPVVAALPEEKPAAAEPKPQEAEFKPIAPETIPEVILKVAESAKEDLPAPIAEESKTVEVIVPAESKLEIIEAPLAAEPADDLPKAIEDAVKAAEEPKAVEESAPIEEPKPIEPAVKLAAEESPVEAHEAAEDLKPLVLLPVFKSPIVAEAEKPSKEAEKIESPEPALPQETVALKSAENLEAAKEVKPAEIPAVAEIPAGNTLVKILAEPEIEKPAEPVKIPEGQAPLKSEAPETILDPVIPEAPAQPLKEEIKP